MGIYFYIGGIFALLGSHLYAYILGRHHGSDEANLKTAEIQIQDMENKQKKSEKVKKAQDNIPNLSDDELNKL
jgi:hypothetical protein